MATAINTIKGWFTTGKFPTQAQFWAWIDAFRHKDDKVPAADIEGLTELLSPVNEHFNDPNAHSDLFANFAEINTILEDKGFVKTSESFTPNSGTRWNLKGQVFTNEVSIEMPISLCSTGFIRIDRVVLDMNNQFVYVIGDEFTENPVPKALPANTLDYTLIPVNDTEVGDPSSPVVGDIYQEKKFDLSQTFNGSGSDVVVELNKLGRRVIVLNGSMTSITGCMMDTPFVNEYPHEGKIFVFINQTDHGITLRHFDATNDFFFIFKNGVDLVLPAGERIEFMLRSGVMDEHFKSWSSIGDVINENNFGAFSNGLTTEDDIQDSDKVSFTDSSDSNKQKKTSWLNIKAKLTTVFNALFVPKTLTLTIGGVTQDLSANRTFTDSSFDTSVLRQRMTNNNYGTSITDIGLSALSQVGTLSSVIKKSSVGNFIGVGSQSSATINSFAGWRDSSGLGQAINFNAPFRYLVTFMFADPAPVANASSAIGFIGSSGMYSAFVSQFQITIGHNIGDTNLKIKSYDGSVVNIDLGANFPANTSDTDIYTFELNYKVTTCDYKVTRHNTGHVATGTFNVPSAILSGVPTEQINRTNNSTALATKIVFFGSKIKS